MTLIERLSRLEKLTPPHAGKPFSASPRHRSEDSNRALCAAITAGYWDRLTAHPVVAETYSLREPTAEQWATVASIARELMATEPPDPNDSGPKILDKF